MFCSSKNLITCMSYTFEPPASPIDFEFKSISLFICSKITFACFKWFCPVKNYLIVLTLQTK
jgi:hypothetical protein